MYMHELSASQARTLLLNPMVGPLEREALLEIVRRNANKVSLQLGCNIAKPFLEDTPSLHEEASRILGPCISIETRSGIIHRG